MVKKINRAEIRGKKLDRDCIRAKTTIGEYGSKDNRVFCYGIIDASTEETVKECRECKAFYDNAEPIK